MSGDETIVSAIQEMSHYIEKYPDRIRKAKEEKGITLKELSEASGVPLSSVSTLNAGKQANPLLYNGAALCKVLGLSLDELFGLSAPPEDQTERLHEIELALARQEGALQAAEARLKLYKRGYTRLLIINSLLIPVIIGYTVWDILNQSVGVFRGEATLLTVLVTVVAAAALAVLIGTVVHLVWMLRKRPTLKNKTNRESAQPHAKNEGEQRTPEAAD